MRKVLSFFKIICILCFIVNFSHAENRAKVIKLKGRVTKLLPGSVKARYVRFGDIIPQDTSIVTRKRSYLVLQLTDGSKITIGPKSKMVLSYNKEKTGSVVSLLKGKLRSKVQKNRKKKLFIT